MIRKLLFILFLYLLLIWIGSYVWFPDTFVRSAMVLSAWGVALLLAGILLERVAAWRRTYRAKKGPKKANPTAPPTQSQDEEIQAFLNLLREADQRLSEAPVQAGATRQKLLDSPCYLLLGPEGVGKTAVLQSCGIDPTLLAGQVSGPDRSIATTRVANIWLAGKATFVELGGRVFGAGSARVAEFIKALNGRDTRAGWREWVRPPQPHADIRAVLLFLDCRELTGAAESRKLDQASQQIRERLFSVADAVGEGVPVFVIFTKADGIRYFPEFFARIGETESKQVFGVLTSNPSQADAANRVWAEAETKRLNGLFQSLVYRLDDYRRWALTQEPDSSRKPSVYEFPREFKKIRTALVQCLVDMFKPDPLNVSPSLAGFFFTGVSRLEQAGSFESLTSMGLRSSVAGAEATQIFQGDATMLQKRAVKLEAPGERRLFAGDLFKNVLTQHHPAVARQTMPSGYDRRRRIVLGFAAAVSALLAIAWTVSWFGNRWLEKSTEAAIYDMRRQNADLSIPSLTALDGLRQHIQELEGNDTLRCHWGLSIGGDLAAVARTAYFARLKRVSLERIQQVLGSQLATSGTAQFTIPGEVYDRLKTYRDISGACDVDKPLVSKILRATVGPAHPDLAGAQTALLDRQLDYYVSNLRPPPVRLEEDHAAEEAARAFLQQAGGVEQQFRALLSTIEGNVPKLVISEHVDYQDLMEGPAEISGAFTPTGLEAYENLVAKGTSQSARDQCVMGKNGTSSLIGNKDELKARYYREYVAKWREFLASCKVKPYKSLGDAATRLQRLSDGLKSPLLGIVQLVALNGSFASPKSAEPSAVDTVKQKLGLKQVEAKMDQGITAAQGLLGPGVHPTTRADLARFFQPAAFTIPAPFDHPVNENNTDYVKALRELGEAASRAAQPAAAADKAAALADVQKGVTKAMDARTGLVDKFTDTGDLGLREPMAALLLQPIHAFPNVQPPLPGAAESAALAKLCKEMKPILSKYPFNPAAPQANEASVDDLKKGFAPVSGLVWKFAQESANELVVKQAGKWQEKPGLQGLKVSPGLLQFLNKAQDFTSAFLPTGEPHLDYTLRPTRGQKIRIQLIIDGTEMPPNSALQTPFHWPAAQGVTPAAEGNVVTQDGRHGFGRFTGLWGVFRLFQSADKRKLGDATVQWSEMRGLFNAEPQTLDPPVKLDIVEPKLPGGPDVLNPLFFEGLQSCPAKAVLAN